MVARWRAPSLLAPTAKASRRCPFPPFPLAPRPPPLLIAQRPLRCALPLPRRPLPFVLARFRGRQVVDRARYAPTDLSLEREIQASSLPLPASLLPSRPISAQLSPRAGQAGVWDLASSVRAVAAASSARVPPGRGPPPFSRRRPRIRRGPLCSSLFRPGPHGGASPQLHQPAQLLHHAPPRVHRHRARDRGGAAGPGARGREADLPAPRGRERPLRQPATPPRVFPALVLSP